MKQFSWSPVLLLKVKYLTYLSSLKTKLSCKRTMNWNKIKIKLFCKRIINENQNHHYPHPAPHHDLALTQLWLVYNVFPLFQLRAACRLCSCERKYRSSPSFRESLGFFHTKTRLLSQSNQGLSSTPALRRTCHGSVIIWRLTPGPQIKTHIFIFFCFSCHFFLIT